MPKNKMPKKKTTLTARDLAALIWVVDVGNARNLLENFRKWLAKSPKNRQRYNMQRKLWRKFRAGRIDRI